MHPERSIQEDTLLTHPHACIATLVAAQTRFVIDLSSRVQQQERRKNYGDISLPESASHSDAEGAQGCEEQPDAVAEHGAADVLTEPLPTSTLPSLGDSCAATEGAGLQARFCRLLPLLANPEALMDGFLPPELASLIAKPPKRTRALF
jgi:hypothetical protein